MKPSQFTPSSVLSNFNIHTFEAMRKKGYSEAAAVFISFHGNIASAEYDASLSIHETLNKEGGKEELNNYGIGFTDLSLFQLKEIAENRG